MVREDALAFAVRQGRVAWAGWVGGSVDFARNLSTFPVEDTRFPDEWDFEDRDLLRRLFL